MSWNPEADLSYAAKLEVVREYFETYQPKVVIETGLYNGQGSCFQFVPVAQVYAIDTDYKNVIAAREKRVEAYQGDSAVMLAQLLPRVEVPALFWLDAHVVTAEREDNASSLMGELAAILAWPYHRESVVLIDDLRMMGLPGWPSLEAVRDKARGVWISMEFEDIMRLTPRGDTPSSWKPAPEGVMPSGRTSRSREYAPDVRRMAVGRTDR